MKTTAARSADADTVRHLLTAMIASFTAAGLERPHLLAELLVAHHVGCARLALPLCYHEVPDAAVVAVLRERAEEVRGGTPIQYALGTVDFMGLTLRADARALIPRPETEVLVEHVLQLEDVWRKERPSVVDVGTGTGCIVLSLAQARGHGAYTAVDTSADALELARENAAGLGITGIRFQQTDLVAGLPAGGFDLVVSNPPYVETAAVRVLPREIRDFEPFLALDGGVDGFSVLSRLVPAAHGTLKSGGRFVVEIGADQASRSLHLMDAAGYVDSCVHPDLAGRDRFVSALKP